MSTTDEPGGDSQTVATRDPSLSRDDARPFGPTARLRFFASGRDPARTRRATDVLVLVECAFVILLVGLAARPPSTLERLAIDFFDAFPGMLDGLWRMGWTLPLLWTAFVFLLALGRRRLTAARDMAVSAGVAVALTMIAAHALDGHSSLGAMLKATGPPAQIPALRLALTGAAIFTARPYLSRPYRRVGRWVLALAAVASLFLATATPSGMVLALTIAVAAAAAVHLAFGSAAGRASLHEVGVALGELGIAATKLEPAARQTSGVFVVRARDDEDRRLVVKIYGRDAYDTQFVAKAWRALWYRRSDAVFTLTRLQQVEHEAFLLLQAGQHGVTVPTVVTAGTTPENDALLVLRGEATPLRDLAPGRVSTELLHRAWRTIAALHGADIVHGRIDGERITVTADDEILLADLASARIVANDDGRRADFAQLLVTTAVALDEARAVVVARMELGDDELAATLPYVQPAALGPDLRRAAKDAGVDPDALRTHVAATLGVELPEPIRLRRVTTRGIVTAALLAFGAFALLSSLSGLDLQELVTELRGAAWGWVAFGLVLAQTPRLTQAFSTRAASPKRLPYGPIVMLQLAISFVNLAVPSSLARIAVNIRFFQRQGLRAATAASIGALDSVAGFVVQITVLLLAFFTGFGNLNLTFNDNSDGESAGHRIIVLLIVFVVGVIVVVALTPRWRKACVRVARDSFEQARATLTSLTPTRLMQLLAANAATEILFALSLGVFVQAFGTTVPLASLLVINVSAALLSGIMPVPGGIGVTEGALIAGLMAAGVNETVAFAGVISYRLASFYLPPIWGAFAYRWLERNRYL